MNIFEPQHRNEIIKLHSMKISDTIIDLEQQHFTRAIVLNHKHILALQILHSTCCSDISVLKVNKVRLYKCFLNLAAVFRRKILALHRDCVNWFPWDSHKMQRDQAHKIERDQYNIFYTQFKHF